MSRRPVIAVPADRRVLHPHPSHVSGEKYLKALLDGANALPIIVPSLPDDIEVDEILERVDGIMLTGSYSNVEPHHYGDDDSDHVGDADPHRDAMTLPLALRALETEDLLRRNLLEHAEEKLHLWHWQEPEEKLHGHWSSLMVKLSMKRSRMAIVSMIPILAMPQWSDIDRLPKETIVVKALSTMARGVLVAKKRRGSPI